MVARSKTSPSKTKTLRQSISIPAPLAAEVRRVAKERDLTISRALVVRAERGVRAERDAQDSLKSAYRKFLNEQDISKKDKAGQDLVRSIFGQDAIAEDPIL